MRDETKLFLSTGYPHELMVRLGEIVRSKGRSILRDQERMLQEYRMLYSRDEENLSKLQAAYEQGIIAGFFEKDAKALWEKHIFLKMSLVRLERSFGEKSAVQVLESLMHVFQWNFRLYVERTWEKNEEASDFHNTCRIPRSSIDLRECAEIKKQHDKPDNHVGKSFSGEEDTEDEPGQKEHDRMFRPRRKESGKKTKREEEREAEGDKKKSGGKVSRTSLSPILQEMKFEDKMDSYQRKEAKKAQKGHADAQCAMGDFYFEEGTDHQDYLEAERWYRLSSAQGYIKARFQLGQIYNKGKGSVENPEREALECFRQLAEENYPTAQCIMGVKYQIGDGVEMDLKRAIGYFLKAARQEHMEAQRRLGDIYMGIGNEKLAFQWYSSAARQGDMHSAAQLKRFSKGSLF